MAQSPGNVYDYEGFTRQLTDKDKHFSVTPVEDFKSADLEENNKKVTRLKTKFTIENTKVVEEGKKLRGDTPETQRSDYNIHMYRMSVATHKASYLVLTYYLEVVMALQDKAAKDKEKKESEKKQADIDEKWEIVQKAASEISPEDPAKQKSKNRPELQPTKLLTAMTVYQMQSWVTQYLQYRKFSKFDSEPLEIQHSLLIANIEDDNSSQNSRTPVTSCSQLWTTIRPARHA